MRANDLAPPTGESFKFTAVGDTLEGTVVYVGDWYTQTNKFNDRLEDVCKIGVDVHGDTMFVWPRKGSAMARALADAIRLSGTDELTEGATLKLMFSEEVDTGKGQPMKQYRAKITPAPNGYTPHDEEEPF